MTKSPIRVYADTSVFGGVFDAPFAEASNEFFRQVRRGEFALVTSGIVSNELNNAPINVRDFFIDLGEYATVVEITEDALRLREAYLQAKIVTRKWEADALHVALSTVAECRLIVSWNFKHIVNFRKIPLYNGVNATAGYGPIGIYTPEQVIADED